MAVPGGWIRRLDPRLSCPPSRPFFRPKSPRTLVGGGLRDEPLYPRDKRHAWACVLANLVGCGDLRLRAILVMGAKAQNLQMVQQP